MNIEVKSYVATPAEVETLAAAIIDGVQSTESGRSTYLRTLIATTQSELGMKARLRNASSSAKLPEATIDLHLKAFESVAKRFGDAVSRVAKATVPMPDAALLRSRTGFARSAASTVRSYIRSGADVSLLAAHSVTKSSLHVAVPRARRRAMSEVRLQAQIARLTNRLEASCKSLAGIDRDRARAALQPALAQLASVVMRSSRPLNDMTQAVEQNAPFRSHDMTYIPIDFKRALEQRQAA